jgi:MHS family proline/betaine transporter-like MFS transporter
VECFLLEKYLTPESLITWGWRSSFIIGGMLGLVGLCLRYRLHETPLFREMHAHTRLVKESIFHSIYKNRVGIFKGILFCAFNSSSFYLISIHFPIYFGEALGIGYKNNLVITMVLLVLMVLPVPLFGKMADRYSNKKMLISAVLGMIGLLYPLYLAIAADSILYMGVIISVFCLLYACNTALIPYIVSDLFSTHDRFTCSGISFNLADAILGGFTPAAALYLLHYTNDPGSFVWILLFVALLSFVGYLYLKPRRTFMLHK